MSRIKVWPASDAVRRVLCHPSAGALTDKADGTSWPADQFTFRRIGEGALLTTPPVSPAPPAAHKREAKSSKPPQPEPGEA